jgi:hypothetical protein
MSRSQEQRKRWCLGYIISIRSVRLLHFTRKDNLNNNKVLLSLRGAVATCLRAEALRRASVAISI